MTPSDLMWRKACAAALAGLPGFGPRRLRAVLADMPPEGAWVSLAEAGRVLESLRATATNDVWPQLRTSVLRATRRTDPLEVLGGYERRGIAVFTPMADDYPARLVDDSDPPMVIFATGSTEHLDRPTVALIGTRQCTVEGRRTANRLGGELAEAGVAVVSGLALGIDGAAHRGALDGYSGVGPIAVVGSGLDVVYPRRHATLWAEVAEHGLLMTESPLGGAPERWRFPARNRIIAALADLVVVVESHAAGGSLLTVEQAANRGREVMAVPGSINSPASTGTNALLRDGCAPVCSTDDVLTALSLVPTGSTPVPVLDPPDVADHEVLDAVDWQPTTTGEVMERTGRSLADVADTLGRLQQLGYLIGMGGWWQRVAEVTSYDR